MIGNFHVVDVLGNQISTWDYFVGLIPGSIGETSVIAILIGAVILLVTGIASWKTMFSVFVGGAAATAAKKADKVADDLDAFNVDDFKTKTEDDFMSSSSGSS